MELICFWMNHVCFRQEFSGGQHAHVTIGRWCHCVGRLDQIHIAMALGILSEQLQEVFIDFGFAMFGQGFIRCHYRTYICVYIYISIEPMSLGSLCSCSRMLRKTCVSTKIHS